MKAAEIIEQRRPSWQRLEDMCRLMSKRSMRMDATFVNEFALRYRDACADLSLAQAYQLPPGTIDYLHGLVAMAHNQLYRSRIFDLRTWADVILFETPRRIFGDPCVHIAALIFWGLFSISGWLAYNNTIWPGFAEDVIGHEQIAGMEESFGSFAGRSWGQNLSMAGFYVFHNAGIGLTCFVSMLPIIPGLVYLSFNAVELGTVFGYMFREGNGAAGDNFKNFVTAHGPFELTAIILSAGAGLRIGISWLYTNNLRRLDSLRLNAQRSLPVALCAVFFFFCAAFIEGFISPVPAEYMPWWFKGLVAVMSSSALLVYFVILGYPWAKQ